MLLQNLRARIGARLNGDKEAGFTLIELLVVMLILGILAAIALPAFFNQKDKATDSKAKENAHSAQVAMETCSTENSGEYTNCSNEKLREIEQTLPSTEATAKERLEPTTVAARSYTVTIKSSTGNTFSISRTATGGFSYTCTIPEAGSDHGGCNVASGATSGTWAS